MVFDRKKQVFDLFRQTYWEKSCGFYFGSCQLPPEEKAEKAIHRQIWGKSCKLAGPIQQQQQQQQLYVGEQNDNGDMFWEKMTFLSLIAPLLQMLQDLSSHSQKQ